MKTSLSSQAQRRTKEKLFHKRSGRLRFLDRIDRIYKIMSIDELCYKVIGSPMAVHRHFGTGYLEEVYKKHKHKYRIYRSPNPVDTVNPV